MEEEHQKRRHRQIHSLGKEAVLTLSILAVKSYMNTTEITSAKLLRIEVYVECQQRRLDTKLKQTHNTEAQPVVLYGNETWRSAKGQRYRKSKIKFFRHIEEYTKGNIIRNPARRMMLSIEFVDKKCRGAGGIRKNSLPEWIEIAYEGC